MDPTRTIGEQIFISNGRLRPIWRFVVSILGILVAFSVAQIAYEIAPQSLKGGFAQFPIFYHLALLLALLGIFKILTAYGDRKPLQSVGLAFHSGWGRELGLGVVMGTVLILIVAGTETAFTLARFETSSLSPGHAFYAGMLYVVVLGVAATNEELIFRGYSFQRLMEAITPAGAAAVSSLVFGLAHLSNRHHTWFSTFNTALVGVMFAIAYLRTRSLWLPIGIHFGWNFALGFVVGLPVSGFIFPDSLLRANDRGAAWVTGGEYGPEGGVLATIVILGGTIYLLLSKRISISEEMKKLTMEPSPAAVFSASSESPAAPRPTDESCSDGPSRQD